MSKIQILIILLVLLSGCIDKIDEKEYVCCRLNNGEYQNLTKSTCDFNRFQIVYDYRCDEEPKQLEIVDTNQTEDFQFYFANSSDLEIARLTSYPFVIEFHADRISFEDKELKVTFIEFESNKVYFLNFDNYDKIVWNIGNRSWTYVKEEI